MASVAASMRRSRIGMVGEVLVEADSATEDGKSGKGNLPVKIDFSPRQGEAPAEPSGSARLGRSLALPTSHVGVAHLIYLLATGYPHHFRSRRPDSRPPWWA